MCVLAEGMGGASDEDSEGPLSAPSGASGHHDECFRPDPSSRREGHQERNGSICQQHHFCPLPVSQPAGAACGPLNSCLSEAIKLLPLFINVVKFSSQIANILDSHAATLNRKSEREVFFMNTQSIVQLVQKLVKQPPHELKPLIYRNDWIDYDILKSEATVPPY